MTGNDRLTKLQERTGYVFSDTELLGIALRHSSYIHENGLPYEACNERLEFLGDAVLEMITSRYLFENYPYEAEGKMTSLRAALVCEQALASDARSIDLGASLELGKGEEKMGGREKPSLLSDAMEAFIGAVYLDGGMEAANDIVCRFVLNDIDSRSLFVDYKSKLQELLQAEGVRRIVYETWNTGSGGDRTLYRSEVFADDRPLGKGMGHNKKTAEQEAAREALKSYDAL